MDGHRRPVSPLFDAHEWLAWQAQAASSWGQRRASAVRCAWAYKALWHILSFGANTKEEHVCVHPHIVV